MYFNIYKILPTLDNNKTCIFLFKQDKHCLSLESFPKYVSISYVFPFNESDVCKYIYTHKLNIPELFTKRYSTDEQMTNEKWAIALGISDVSIINSIANNTITINNDLLDDKYFVKKLLTEYSQHIINLENRIEVLEQESFCIKPKKCHKLK